jgi:hypothetical protein
MNKLIAIGALVLGFGGGAWWGYQAGPGDSPASEARTEIPKLVIREQGLSPGPGRADIDPSVLRALIREEVTAAMAGKGGGNAAGSPAVPTPAQAPVAAEKQAQGREALEQIEALVAQGTWGNDQRMSFHEKFLLLDAQQRDQAMERFATAVNSGTLTIKTDGPPL